jgi:hypothetical protein
VIPWLIRRAFRENNAFKSLITMANPFVVASCSIQQILCLAELVAFTSRCENAISANKLPSLLTELNAHLKQMTSIDTNDDRLLQIKVCWLRSSWWLSLSRCLVCGLFESPGSCPDAI